MNHRRENDLWCLHNDALPQAPARRSGSAVRASPLPHARGKGGRIGDVAEHHRYQLVFALVREARGRYLLDKMWRGAQMLGGCIRAQPHAALPAKLLRVRTIVQT